MALKKPSDGTRHMRNLKKIYRKFLRNRLILAFIDIKPQNLPRIMPFVRQYKKYKSISTEQISVAPILGDDTTTTNIDPHYFYQAIWTAKHIAQTHPPEHVDIGSQAQFVASLTVLTKVKFVDIRPLDVKLENLTNTKGSILDLPFSDNSIDSLSCLHVAEHIGLGRYGDKLDPEGTKKACQELTRVLAKDGNLYFSLPIGRERTEFNAHRIHQPQTIIDYFSGLTLIEFSAINDRGHLVLNARPLDFKNSQYGCGLFHFKRT